MKASELIAKLQLLVTEHGDLPCTFVVDDDQILVGGISVSVLWPSGRVFELDYGKIIFTAEEEAYRSKAGLS